MKIPMTLANKVVVVTGAGRGIGREIALLCARQGAAVVVNDVGTSTDGRTSEQGSGEEVVTLIREAGGRAVLNGASVADPASALSIVEDAVSHFGAIHGVVNNAGILRDRMFYRMDGQDWRDVIDVHLNGAFAVSRAAAPHFQKQGFGAYVHMTSTAGLVGARGQSNYAAAKLGIVGLSNSIAHDMQRFGVRSNCIAPFAWSRMIATIPATTPEEIQRVERMKSMSADKIAPLAAALLSDAAGDITGQIFGVRKNEIFLFSQPRPVKSLHRSEGWSPESVAEELFPAMRPSMLPLMRSVDVWPYDPV